MNGEVHTQGWFADRLRQAISHKGYSVRQAARYWRPDCAEDARHSLHRYLSGRVVPGDTIRRELAAVLDVPSDHFQLEPTSPLHWEPELVATLMQAVELSRFLHLGYRTYSDNRWDRAHDALERVA